MIPTDVTTLNSHEAASPAAFLSAFVEDIFFYDFQLSAETSLFALHESKYNTWRLKVKCNICTQEKYINKINWLRHELHNSKEYIFKGNYENTIAW